MDTSFSERAATRLTSRVFFPSFQFKIPLTHLLLLAIAILAASAAPAMAQDNKMKCPPPTRVEEVKETIHGVVVSDPSRWLEDQNSPETRAWIDTQNACTQSLLKTLPGSEAIAKRLGELI